MKTTRIGIVSLVVAVLFVILACHANGQMGTQPTPDAILQPIAPGEIPSTVTTFYSLSNYLSNGGSLGPPLPFLRDSNATVYSLDANQMIVLVDDTGGTMTNDEAALDALALLLQPQDTFSANVLGGVMTMDDASGGGYSPMFGGYSFDTNSLWLEITNVSDGVAYLNLHNATNQVYAIWSTTNLPGPWNVESELWPTDSVCMPFTELALGWQNLFFRAEDWTGVTENGNTVPDWWFWKYFGTVDLSDTNLDAGGIHTLLYDYTNGIVPIYSFHVITPPLGQEVFEDDNVTMNVETGGNTNLTYQWTFDATEISGATNSSYTIYGFQSTNGGNYAVVISDGTNSITTSAAQLADQGGTGGSGFIMFITGPRQDYTFRSGVTYVISPYFFGSPVTLYGKTVIESGAVLKFDTDNSTNASVKVLGDLECQSQPYNPAILTCIDDDFTGETLEGYEVSTGSPITAPSGTGPYLDLTYATNASIQNLRVCFADQGITTPLATRGLDIWDCQFLQCNYGVVNLIPNATNSLHNVLFAACGAAIGASTNSIEVDAEQVTADAADFCLSSATPNRIALTNSIIWGTTPTASSLSTVNVAFNPDNSNFMAEGLGGYYLAANSPLHNSGTAGISARLQTELQAKSTYAPLEFSAFLQVNGTMTLAPQSPRFQGGQPDCGYYYDALDYAVANMVLKGGSLTVLPGTAIAVENQFLPNTGVAGTFTTLGFDCMQGTTVNSYGTPIKPIVYTAEKQVQENPNVGFANFQQFLLGQEFDALWFDAIMFVPDFEGDGSGLPSPVINFRFCHFYMPPNDYHVWAGGDDNFDLYYGDPPWQASYDSSVDMTVQDCTFFGGRINLGNPDVFQLPDTQVYPSCTVSLLNNSFDDTALNLEPTFYQYLGPTNALNMDFAFQAYNNLFRRSPVIHLEPVPASAGDWIFENNLFDKSAFIQSVEGLSAPLDYGYNGNYPLEISELGSIKYRFGFGTNLLAPTMPDDGFVDGTGDVTLSQALPYQAGPFGNYYMSTNTLLYGAGSSSAAAMGLYHYTTRIDQTKEGNEQLGHQVNIGVHYVAATNISGTCDYALVDSDGDGIPDYVENWHGDGNYSLHSDSETDWLNPMTDGVNPDPSNSVYLDIDLSGNGLTGLMKKTLGIAPFDTSNPLKLTQVTMGDEPDFATFEVPLSYSVLTNSGTLNLNMNGIDVTLEDCTAATDGHCLLSFNVPFDPTGLHFLSAQFHLNTDSGSDHPIVTASGNPSPYWSSNDVQFFEMGSMFDDSGAYLDAESFYSNADYTIELSDLSTTPPTLLNTITNSTSTGFIQEDWNLVMSDGLTTYTGATVQAAFSVKPSGTPGTPHKWKKVVTRAQGSLSEWGPNMDVVYFRTPTNDAFEVEFAKNGIVWNSMQGVVNALIDPVWTYSVYNSYFNRYLPDPNGEYPGYITKRSPATNDPPSLITVQNLLGDITNGVTKQIYIHGHGTNGWMGNYNGSAYISANDVGSRLGNTFAKKGGLTAQQPYRFVFLDGCDTASGKDWRRSFGIFPLDSPNQAARNKTGPQAYVGWGTVTTGLLNFKDHTTGATDQEQGYVNTLAKFYSAWMSGNRLRDCLNSATTVSANCYPLPVDKNKNFTFTINNNSYTITNRVTSKLYLIGYPGLQVDRTDHTLDTDKTYAAPTNVE